MEISQINIKMNQKMTGVIVSKDMKQNGESMKSFSDILAMFDNLVQSGTVVQAADPSLENEALDEPDLHVLTDEDIIVLDLILMSLIAVNQEGTHSESSLHDKSEKKSSIEVSQLQLNQSPDSLTQLQGLQSSESKSLLQDVHPSRSSLSPHGVESPNNSLQIQGKQQTLEGNSFVIGEQASRSSSVAQGGEFIESSQSQGLQPLKNSIPDQTGNISDDQVRHSAKGSSVLQGDQQPTVSITLDRVGHPLEGDGAFLQASQFGEASSNIQGIQAISESRSLVQESQVDGAETVLQARQPVEGSTVLRNDQISDLNLLNQNQLTSDNDEPSLLVSRSLFDESQTLGRHSQLEGIITKLGQLIELQASHSEEPGQWSQKSIEILQTSDENLNVLMRKLARTIVQSDVEGTGVFDLESLKIVDNIESIPLPTDRTSENRMYQGQGLYNQNSQAGALETETWLGMGKYKTISTPSESNQGLQSLDGNRVDQQIPLNGGNPLLSQRSDLVDSKNVIPSINLPVSEFVPEVSEWMGRYMRVNTSELGKAEAKFSLFPQHFGHIEIKITSNDGQISAQILTNSSAAQEALEGQLNLLRQALQQQGLVVQKLDIIQQTPSNIDVNQSGQTFSQNQSESSHEQREFSQTQQGLAREQDESEQQNTTKKELVSITYGGPSRSTTSQIDFTA